MGVVSGVYAWKRRMSFVGTSGMNQVMGTRLIKARHIQKYEGKYQKVLISRPGPANYHHLAWR